MMRTPGRCTNTDACWLANGRRDVWVPVGDEFVCPVCATRLQAPPPRAVTASGVLRAVATGAALGFVAGGAGLGLMRALHAAPPLRQAVVWVLRHHQPAADVPGSAAPARPAAGDAALAARKEDGGAVVAGGDTAAADFVSAPVTLGERQIVPPLRFAAAAAPLTMPPAQTVLVGGVAADLARADKRAPGPLVVAAAIPPGHALALGADLARGRLVLPIRTAPLGPEESEGAQPGRWHPHPPAPRETGFLPGPGWTSSDDETIAGAAAAYPMAQGDSDEAPGPLLVADSSAAASPAGRDGTVPGATWDNGPAAVPASVLPAGADRAVPRGGAGALAAPTIMPAVVTNLTVPAPALRDLDQVPAQRVEAASANAVIAAPDAPARLWQLPAARPAALVTPDYPPAAADAGWPGRVNVDCIITVRGVPDGCQVKRQAGGHGFAQAVLSWLHSGAVRYRPHLVKGRATPEQRLYDVRFEP